MMHVLPPVDGRGHRSPNTLLLLDERDRYLRTAARFYPGCSDREIARLLRAVLVTFRNGRWRRDRVETTCPLQHRGKLQQVLWLILKTRDAIPSERTIRRALSGAVSFHGPPSDG
jgi:hypothetical protein